MPRPWIAARRPGGPSYRGVFTRVDGTVCCRLLPWRHGGTTCSVPGSGGTWQCERCGQSLQLEDGQRPRTSVRAISGSPNVYVVRVDGKEIHRCEEHQGQFRR